MGNVIDGVLAEAKVKELEGEVARLNIDKENLRVVMEGWRKMAMGPYDRRQAIEGLWDTVARCVQAVGHERGWRNDDQRLVYIVTQLDRERGPRLLREDYFNSIKHLWEDDYAETTWEDVERAIIEAAHLIDLLRDDKRHPPMPYTILGTADQFTIAQLLQLDTRPSVLRDRSVKISLDCILPPGLTSDAGFSPAFGYQVPDAAACCARR